MFKTRRVQVIKCEFCAEGRSEGSLISEMSLSLYGVQFFECSSYGESTVLINFQNFLLNFKQNPSKYLKNWFWPLSHHHCGKNTDI